MHPIKTKPQVVDRCLQFNGPVEPIEQAVPVMINTASKLSQTDESKARQGWHEQE